ncbi:MAG: helix-turn-helix domain-containing protein [Wujia sp.]
MTIKEAAAKLHVEAYVLRYWEDELGLTIKRNNQGHRYYDERDIRMFEGIKEMKEKGLMLKDIRDAIAKTKDAQGRKIDRREQPQQSIHKIEGDTMVERMEQVVEQKRETEEKVVDFKQAHLQAVMNKVIATALRENKDIITSSIKQEITTDVMRQFDAVMREQEEREEQRYRKLDAALREIQQSNLEVAATSHRRRFGRKKG